MSAASDKLKLIELQIERLQVQREVLREVVSKEARDARAAANAQGGNATNFTGNTGVSNLSDLRPTSAKITFAILNAVNRYPTKTLKQITDIVVKESSTPEDKKRIYATGYGLIRRNRIQKDPATKGLTTTFTGLESDLEGG